MEKIEYDMDTSGGIMEQIQAIIAPPHSAEERKRLIKEKEQKGQAYSRRHGNRNGGRNGGKTINRDCCDSCCEGGDLLCCDRCPASFHFQCCEPPLEEDDIPTGEWICNECKATLKLEKQQKPDGQQREENKSPVPTVSTPVVISKPEMAFPQLAKVFKDKNPKEFSLPMELQDFTVFPGDRKLRVSKSSDNGKNGKREETEENLDRLCFACSRYTWVRSFSRMRPYLFEYARKAGPFGFADLFPCKFYPYERCTDVKFMAACDFCPLVFHVDCLHPPMVSPPTTMWMCPNHPENYENRLEDPRYCVRMDLTDELRRNVNQNTIVLDFIRRAKRERILSNRKRKIQRRMIVPNAIKQEYKNPTILQLPSYIQRMMEPLPPHARPLSLPSQSDKDEWLKSLVALQCDIANEITKASVPAPQKESQTNANVKAEPAAPLPEVKSEIQNEKAEDIADISLEANEKMDIDDDANSDEVSCSAKKNEETKSLVIDSNSMEKPTLQQKNKQQVGPPTVSSSNSSKPSTSAASPMTYTKKTSVVTSTSTQKSSVATSTSTQKTSVATSTPKIIILATQTSSGSKAVNSSCETSNSSQTTAGDSSTTGSTSTKSVIIKSSSDSQRVQTSGTSHFVSSITSESLQDPLLSQLDQRLVKVLAFQRLQQLLGQTKAPQTTNKKITASNIQEILANNKPKGHAIAALCSLTAGPTVSMIHRSLNIGQGSDNDVTLPIYGHCNYISSKHACIFFDAETRQFELLNYSEHGTIVDNVLYSCDFSDKPNRNVTSSSARMDDNAKFFEKGRKTLPFHTTKGHGIESIVTPCSCRASGSSLIGGSGAGWEGTAVLHHGSFIKFGCLHFVFSIVESATKQAVKVTEVKEEVKS